MEKNRRNFLLGTSVVAAGVAMGGYNKTLSSALTLSLNGREAKDEIYADGQLSEGVISTSFDKNSDITIRNGICNGCTTHCGMRIKIDNKTKWKC